MKKILYILPVILLLAAGCDSKNKVSENTPATNSQNPTTTTIGKPDEFINYRNKTFHFSLQIPKESYPGYIDPSCTTTEPVTVTEKDNVISIGTQFKNCPGVDPEAFVGWNIYATSNIKSQQDAQNFLDKTFGKGCKISEWGNPSTEGHTANGSAAFLIDSLHKTADSPFGDCKFSLTSKYRTFYSPEYKTIVFWSLGQEPAFPSRNGMNDDKALESFMFTQ